MLSVITQITNLLGLGYSSIRISMSNRVYLRSGPTIVGPDLDPKFLSKSLTGASGVRVKATGIAL